MTQYKVKSPAFVPGFFNAMDAFLKDDFTTHQKAFHPAVNIIEHNHQYDVVLSVPGLSKDDFKLSVENDLLTISFEKQEEKTEEKPKFIKKEFAMHSFKRSFNLSEDLNRDEISAKYENGLLTVSIPKKEVKETVAKNIVIN